MDQRIPAARMTYKITGHPLGARLTDDRHTLYDRSPLHMGNPRIRHNRNRVSSSDLELSLAWSRPRIHHLLNRDTSFKEQFEVRIRCRIIGVNDSALTRDHRKTADVTCDRICQHHAGTIITGEDQWALHCAGRNHYFLCPNAPQSLT